MDLESVDNLQNVIFNKVIEVTMRTENMMDLQNVMYKIMKVNLTRGNMMHAAKKESLTYLPNSMTYLPNSMTYLLNKSRRRHIRQGKLHVACIPIKPIKNQSMTTSAIA